MASGSASTSTEGRGGRARLPTREAFRCVEEEEEEGWIRTRRHLSWNSESSRLLNPSHSLIGRTSRAVSLLAHPHLPILISGGSSPDHTVRVWDLESRALLRTLEGHTETVWGLALDPAGRRLATGSDDHTVRLWDLDSGACLRTLEKHSEGFIMSAVWDATGSLVAAGSIDKIVHVWDAASGDLRHALEGHGSFVYALTAHPTDDLLASGSDDCSVCVWRWSSGGLVHTLTGHAGSVMSLAASASFIVSGSGDKSVRVWSWASGECVRVLDGFDGKLLLNSLSWRDSTLVTLENGGSVRVWDASSADPREWSCVGPLVSLSSSPYGAMVLVAGRVACAASGGVAAIAVWGVE